MFSHKSDCYLINITLITPETDTITFYASMRPIINHLSIPMHIRMPMYTDIYYVCQHIPMHIRMPMHTDIFDMSLLYWSTMESFGSVVLNVFTAADPMKSVIILHDSPVYPRHWHIKSLHTFPVFHYCTLTTQYPHKTFRRPWVWNQYYKSLRRRICGPSEKSLFPVGKSES